MSVSSATSSSPSTPSRPPAKTTATTASDPYKSEFVKVYQDAGVIGAAMLTLLAICVLLSILAFRLAKMYSTLITARDSLDAQRVAVIEKLTLAVVEVKGMMQSVRDDIMINRQENSGTHQEIVAEVRRVCDRIDRAEHRTRQSTGTRKNREGSGKGS
jgi:hypothetical protein